MSAQRLYRGGKFRFPAGTRGWAPLAALAVGMMLAAHGLAQPYPEPSRDYWFTDGRVNAILVTNETIYVGGSFSYIGPQTGPGVVCDPVSGNVIAPLPRVNGYINVIEPDGAGGWFVGGQFTAVDSCSMTNLVHVRSDMTVDTAFDARLFGGQVMALALNNGVLYIGGQIQRIGGVNRQAIAAVSAVDGSLEPWNPEMSGSVNVMVLADGLLYVGGQFGNVGSKYRSNLAAIGIETAQATDWTPNPDQAVLALLVDGNTVYAGGQFTSIGGKPRNRLAALDAASGVASNWNPNPNNIVRALSLTANAVYVGGDFTSISVQNRNKFAGVNRANGAALPINLKIEGQAQVRAIRIVGNTIFVAGNFDRAQDQQQPMITAADLETGESVAAVPLGTLFNGTSDNGVIGAIGAAEGRVVFGGSFQSLGGVRRTHAAAVSAVTGRVLPWTFTPSSPVLALASAGTRVYAGGGFTNANDTPVRGLVAVNATSGDVDETWRFGGTNRSGNLVIRSLLPMGDRLFVGGSFSGIGEVTVRQLGAVLLGDGSPLKFDAGLTGGSEGVTSMAVSGSNLYIAGDFNGVGGVAVSRLAVVNEASGELGEWRPAPNREVNTLAVAGDRLYVGGPFTAIADVSIRNLAVFETPSHMLLPWDAALSVNAQAITSIAATETSVYIAGNYDSIGGEYRLNMSCLSPLTAEAFEWNPSPNQPPSAVVITDRLVCLGGQFRTFGTAPKVFAIGNFAVFRRVPGIVSVGQSPGKLLFTTTTGDRNYAVLESSIDLLYWFRVSTNNVPGRLWHVEQPTESQSANFFRVSAE